MNSIINAELFPTPSSKTRNAAKAVLDGGGWIYIHAYISQLRQTPEDAGAILFMVHTERNGKNRPYILNRLYRCFANMRRNLEETALYAAY